MIIVIGDVMLDTYYEGVVNRISPEAPVPVLLIANETHSLGGAANVARNIATLGGDVTLFSVVGQDATGDKIANELSHHTDVAHAFVHDPDRWSTSKTRYEAHGQQILRVDDECTDDLSPMVSTILIERVLQHMSKCSIMVLSDYAKGVLSFDVCQTLINIANEHKIPVIVDPKSRNWSKYKGATIIKPNALELSQATGMATDTKEECLAAAFLVRDTFNIGSVLVTRGHKGMLLAVGNDFHEEPGKPREVANVVGAGDTALAALAVGIHSGLSLTDAMALANAAAAIAVGKHGTASVTRQEIKDAFV